MAVGQVIKDFKPVEEPQVITGFQPIQEDIGLIPSHRPYQPEPPPFKMDAFINDWQKTRPMDEDPPQDDVANIFDNFARPFQKLYHNFGSSLNRGIGSFYSNLDAIFEYSEEKRIAAGGKPIPPEKRGHLFKKWGEQFEENADYWQALAAKSPPDFINEWLGKFIGGLGPGVAEFTLGLKSLLVYPLVLGAAEAKKQGMGELGQTVNGILKAAETGTLGLIFKALHPYTLYTKAPILGTTFGVEDVAKQLVATGKVDPDMVVEATATGFGLGLTPGGRMGLKDIAKNMRTELSRGEARIEAKKVYDRMMEKKRAEAEVKPEVPIERVPQELKAEVGAVEKGFFESLPETIAGVALKTNDGTIITGKTLGIPGRVHADLYNELSLGERKGIADASGFITSKGRYLTNKEASDLVGGLGAITKDASEIVGREIKREVPLIKPEAKVEIEPKPELSATAKDQFKLPGMKQGIEFGGKEGVSPTLEKTPLMEAAIKAEIEKIQPKLFEPKPEGIDIIPKETEAVMKQRMGLFKKPEKQKALIAWLKSKGGINITDPSADITAWRKKESGFVGLITKKGKFIDELAQEWWWETGNKMTTDQFAEMIGDHIMSTPKKGKREKSLDSMSERELDRYTEKAQREWSDFMEQEAKESQAGRLSIFGKLPPKPPAFEFTDPKIEKSYQESLPKKIPFTAKAGDYFTDMWHKMTRTYEHLPRTKEFAELQFDLKKLEKQKAVASYDAVIDISKTLSALKGEDYNLFTRKVILDDLSREAGRGHDIPWGFNKDSIKVELNRIDSEIASNKVVQDALGKRKAMWDKTKDEYTKAMEDIGFDVSDKIKNEDYFRHQVLEYTNLHGLFGTGKKLKTPSSRGFLKAREGSELNINRDFIQPEYEVVSQMLYDIQVARTIKDIDKNYSITKQVQKDAKAKGLENWHEAIPPGYVSWQPREGNVFYMVDSIPAKLAEKLHKGVLGELGITEADLRKSVAIGGKRKEFVVKEEVAKTLDELVKAKSPSVIGDADRALMRGMKAWFLFAPRRYLKYEARNMTGDADASFVGNPSGFLKTPRATKELGDVLFGKKEITGELKEFFNRGGFESTLFAQEMGNLKSLWTFERLYKEQNIPGVTEIPYRVWKKYWKTIRVTNTFRETILRYGNYLDYLEQMKKNPEGKPDNFGASKREEIMGLKDIRDRAYWLSNDLLGAYDRISVMGQHLREYWYPFWSWKELNFKRYTQFAKNAAEDGRLAQVAGKKMLGALAGTPFMAYKVGKFLLSATAFWGALQVWNNTMFPEEEDELSEDIKSQPHIVLGRDTEGNILYFNRIGALGDYLEWFGLDSAPKDVGKWLKGEKTLKEIAEDMVKSPINVIITGISPQAKVPAEVITGRTLFPDAFKPGTIRDRGFYLARVLGIENEYKEVAGLPSKGYAESLKNFLIYTADPGQGAYSDIQEAKRRWLKEQGKGAEGFWLTPKGNALYNFKLAIRYEDLEAANKYMYEYYVLEGTAKGIEESLERMHPLSGLSKQDKRLFEQSLSPDQIKRLGKAIEFYHVTLKRRTP